MKRIAFLNTMSFWGGGEKLHFDCALWFRKQGYDVSFICISGSPLSQRVQESGFNQFHFSAGNLSFLNPIKWVQFQSILKKNNVDTLIFSSSHDTKIGALAASFIRLPRIVYYRGLAAPVKGSALNKWIYLKCITHLIANSKATSELMGKNIFPEGKPNPIQVIYHGINLQELDSQANQEGPNYREKTKGIVLGNAGRLTPQKGQHLLIEVAKILKIKGHQFTLLIAGTGPSEKDLEQLIISQQLDDVVKLEGFVSNVSHFMRSLDIFLLSSFWEGFGFVIAEAMAQSKPVIAFNVSSNPELIVNHETGFLIDHFNVVEFANKVEQLILNEKKRKEMGALGRERVVSNFEMEDRMKEFELFLLKTR